jgi:hypothetical protein
MKLGDDIPARRAVWNALSDLFLDTELVDDDFERMANTLALSPFTTEQIESILRLEVTPAVKSNLRSMAGEWAGFDEDWLAERILSKVQKESFWNRKVSRLVRSDWEKIKKRIQIRRNEK